MRRVFSCLVLVILLTWQVELATAEVSGRVVRFEAPASAAMSVYEIEVWSRGRRFHGQGQWSVPLEKGPHEFLVTFADARHRDRTVPDSGLWRGYPAPWVVWPGESPVVDLSGPGFRRSRLPNAWLKHSP